MVRVGGLHYSIDPSKRRGKRIRHMELKGKPISATKKYVLAGWAGVEANQKGPPVWDVVGDYMRHKKVIHNQHINTPRLINVHDNKGIGRKRRG